MSLLFVDDVFVFLKQKIFLIFANLHLHPTFHITHFQELQTILIIICIRLFLFRTIFSKRRLIDCMIYNSLMSMFQRQIIAFVAEITIILKYSRIVEYWTNLSMIFTIIAFDDITLTSVHSMKSTFVKMNLNHHFVNVFDYLSTRRVEFKFIVISSTMFAFNAASSTSAIKQNDVLLAFFDNVKNA